MRHDTRKCVLLPLSAPAVCVVIIAMLLVATIALGVGGQICPCPDCPAQGSDPCIPIFWHHPSCRFVLRKCHLKPR